MTRFTNFCKKIREHDYKVVSTSQSFARDKLIEFECIEGHSSCMNENSFINKTATKSLQKLLSLCGKCNTHLHVLQKIQKRAEELEFKILRLYEDNLTVEYICKCGSINKSNVKALHQSRRTKSCPKCQNDPFKVLYTDLQKTFTDKGCELLTQPQEYKNNKQLLSYKCICGEIGTIVYNDLKRGRLCINCKLTRAKDTSFDKYGFDNPSKSDEIKQKIVNTNMERHGVAYAMQSPELFRKAQQSSFQRRKYVSPYGKEFMVMGYEDVFLEEFFKEYQNTVEIYGGEDIDIPVIDYEFNGKNHKYYPDFYIPELNELIEIKSIYLYEKDTDEILAKAEASAKTYKYRLVVYKNRRELAFVKTL